MRALLIVLLILVGCDSFPDELAKNTAQGEYRGFESELRLEHPEYQDLYDPRDGAIAAHEVQRLWGVEGNPDWAPVYRDLQETKVLVLGEDSVRKACMVPEEAGTPAGCLYAYHDKPRAVVWAEYMEDKPLSSRLKLLCHEFLHAARWRAIGMPDYAHEDKELWKGKDSIVFRCAQHAEVHHHEPILSK